MSQRSDELWEKRTEDAYDSFSEHPVRKVLKWLAIGVVAILLLGAATGVAGWIGGWWHKAAEVTGAENTDTQFTALYTDIESMKAAAANTCAAKDAKAGPNSPTLLEDPSFAYAAKYRSIAADYNRRFENIFEAKALIVKPSDLPREAPTLEEMETQVC
jgi:hypothetical protein